QRILEEAAAVVDAGEPRAAEELLTEHVAPDLLDFLYLGEEAVAAHVEVKAPVRLCPGEAPHHVALLEDDGREPLARDLSGGGETGRTRPDHDHAPFHRHARLNRRRMPSHTRAKLAAL